LRLAICTQFGLWVVPIPTGHTGQSISAHEGGYCCYAESTRDLILFNLTARGQSETALTSDVVIRLLAAVTKTITTRKNKRILHTKVLARRLAPHIHTLAAHNQSAFIQSRLIHENYKAVQLTATSDKDAQCSHQGGHCEGLRYGELLEMD